MSDLVGNPEDRIAAQLIIEAISGLLQASCKSGSFKTSPLHSKLFFLEKITPS